MDRSSKEEREIQKEIEKGLKQLNRKKLLTLETVAENDYIITTDNISLLKF